MLAGIEQRLNAGSKNVKQNGNPHEEDTENFEDSESSIDSEDSKGLDVAEREARPANLFIKNAKKNHKLKLSSRHTLSNEIAGKLPLGKLQPRSIIPRLTSTSDTRADATLYAAAGGLGAVLKDGVYDAIVAERFDIQSDRVSWARDNMHAKYWHAIESLAEQLDHLRTVYLASLPRAVDGLRAHNPYIPDIQLLEAAIESLDEELTPIIDILRIWTDAFAQRRSGKYKELDAIVFCVEQTHYLFQGTDAASMASAEVKARLNTVIFQIGCVYLARFSSAGPATLPAGPVGAHAFEVPHDERNVIAIMLILYMHEFRHDIFHDVVGLGDELVTVIAKAITEASKKEQFSLSQKTIKIGKQKIPMLNLLIKLFIDTIGEVDADISGGVLLCGPAYLYNMLSTSAAMNSQEKYSTRNSSCALSLTMSLATIEKAIRN